MKTTCFSKHNRACELSEAKHLSVYFPNMCGSIIP
jgi:hypothetical protein